MPEQPPTKPWWKSTTIWVNIGAFLSMLIPIVGTQLGDIIGTERALQVASVIGLINAILGIAIRAFLTSTAIKPGTAG